MRNLRNGAAAFEIDPKYGFRPIVGTPGRSVFGTINNGYDVHNRQGKRRLLFIGDSVTNRGKIIEGLKSAYGEERYEYWNAGVESFNTVQQVNFYKEYNHRIHPDHVILTFHNNDFQVTPVAFKNAENELIVIRADESRIEINRWFFSYSHIYRLLVRTAWSAYFRSDDGRSEVSRTALEIEEHLRALRDTLAEDDIAFTVLIHPVIKSYERWRPNEVASREKVREILDRLDICYFDLLQSLDDVVPTTADIDTLRQKPKDTWHPSPYLADQFANYLWVQGLLRGNCD